MRVRLTVGQLKKMIADLPDDMMVVSSGRDHNFRRVQAWVVPARQTPISLDEHYEEIPLEDGEKVIQVLQVD